MKELIYQFESKGRLLTDPLKSTKHYKPWYSMIQINGDISDYYSWFLYKKGIKVFPNKLWNSHITISKNTEPVDIQYWQSITGMPITYYYANEVFENENYYWLNVFVPEANEIRAKLGFTQRSLFHLTIGRKTPN